MECGDGSCALSLFAVTESVNKATEEMFFISRSLNLEVDTQDVFQFFQSHAKE
jgi:hypothetical protein